MGSYVAVDNHGKTEIHSGPGKIPSGTRFVVNSLDIALHQEPAEPMEIKAARLASPPTPKKEIKVYTMAFKILSARRTESGILVKAEQELVDTARTLEEARKLQKEYALAFGDKIGVWVEDPQGKDLQGCYSRRDFHRGVAHTFMAAPWDPIRCQWCAETARDHQTHV